MANHVLFAVSGTADPPDAERLCALLSSSTDEAWHVPGAHQAGCDWQWTRHTPDTGYRTVRYVPSISMCDMAISMLFDFYGVSSLEWHFCMRNLSVCKN